MTLQQIRNNRMRMASFVPGLSIACTIDHAFILKKENAVSGETAVVAVGEMEKGERRVRGGPAWVEAAEDGDRDSKRGPAVFAEGWGYFGV